MSVDIYVLKKIPDLTLAQYSAQESGGVKDVLHQHAIFYRQLNRKGLLFNEVYQLVYVYDPNENPGKRISAYFETYSNDSSINMDEFIQASSLSNYFKLINVNKDEKEKEKISNSQSYSYQASLAKSEVFVQSSLADNDNKFYRVNEWKPNNTARLMGLFRMMQKLDQPVAYSITMKAEDLSLTFRNDFAAQIQYIKNMSKGLSGKRDDNAEGSVKVYEKLFDKLSANPHFRCNISAYANDESVAKLLLDAAASEAVEEGNYSIVCENGIFDPVKSQMRIKAISSQEAPRQMRKWSTTFLLNEVVPFATLPTLFAGEIIELPKESAPNYDRNGLYLGKDNSGFDVYMPLDLLPKHALLAGVPGSGKTYSMLHIASNLAKSFDKDGNKGPNIPILVLEPAKKEYRALAYNKRLPDLLIFSPGSTGSFPLRINPFEFPLNIKLNEHITNLIAVFNGAFDLEPPMPFLISKSIEQVYRNHGWYPFEINRGQHTYPNLQELYDEIEKQLNQLDYAQEVKSNLKSCLQVRIGSLIEREMGNVFNVSGSTFSPEEWLNVKCVIELESLGLDAANFLTLLLLTIVRELLRINPSADKTKPRHVIFLEEAHNLIGPTTVANAQNGDAKVASTKYIVDMLAEVRALREAIIIADQLPTSLAPQVVKNTSLKLAHRITAMDDRQLLASTMSADGIQLEKMGSFQPGHTLCLYEKVQKPFEVQISAYDDIADPPSNDELFDLLKERSNYKDVMKRDYQIIIDKFNTKFDLYQKRNQLLNDKLVNFVNQHKILKDFEIKSRTDSRYIKECEKQRKVIDNAKSVILSGLNSLNDNWFESIFELYDYLKMNVLERQSGNVILKSQFQAWAGSVNRIYVKIGEDNLAKKVFERANASGIKKYLQESVGE